jgi:hypothetical protein
MQENADVDDIIKNVPQLKRADLIAKKAEGMDDVQFFSGMACHILAKTFIECYPDAGFEPYLIRPKYLQKHPKGFHVFVARGNQAFDVHGYANPDQLVSDYTANRRQHDVSWEAQVERLSGDPTGSQLCAQYGFLQPSEIPGDPWNRARKVLSTFPPPSNTDSKACLTKQQLSLPNT